MAQKIIFRYGNMNQTVTKISELSDNYKTAGVELIDALNTAMGSWEGDSKDKFAAFINGDVNTYITQTIPDVVKGLSEMLASNAKQMQNADSNIAKQLPTKL